MSSDELNEGSEIGADHPSEQEEQQQQIDPQRDHHAIAREQQHSRDRGAGDNHRQEGCGRKAAEAVGRAYAAHEHEQRDRRAELRVDDPEQRQDPEHEARVEDDRDDTGSDELAIGVLGGEFDAAQAKPLDQPDHADREQ
ncbi:MULTISPECIES: hypothetical protein [Bradyrhizobium]|uniref:hypothetical protein n=1 Tax=Bradyrhizobium TaxID=374 RepID=UPI001EDC2E84|nr:hypothetical protein [Bradyrhizobium zhengyangense]